MIFRKKRPQRLYYPTKAKWYRRPRRKTVIRPRSGAGSFARLRKKTNIFLKKPFYLLLVAFSVLALFLLFLFSAYFSVAEIRVVREDPTVDSSRVTDQLNPYLGRNLVFFPRKTVLAKLQENFPEFSSIHLSKNLPRTLEVHLESQPMVANLKAYYTLPLPEPEPLTSEEERQRQIQQSLEQAFSLEKKLPPVPPEPEPVEQKGVLNRVGQVLLDREENLELMTLTVEGLTQPLEDRETVIPPQRMETILETSKYFSVKLEMQIQSIVYLPVARELHLKIQDGPWVWFNIEKDFREQVDRIHSVYAAAGLNKEPLAYIDLRVNEKVIYCPQGASCAAGL